MAPWSRPQTHGATWFFLAYLAERCCDGSDFTVARRKVCQAAARINEIFDVVDYFLSPSEAREVDRLMNKMLLRYEWLSNQAIAQGFTLWHLVPKHHYASHLGRQCLVVNPRYTRTYLEEGLMGAAGKMYRSYIRGTYKSTIQRTFLLKYLLGMQVQMFFSS